MKFFNMNNPIQKLIKERYKDKAKQKEIFEIFKNKEDYLEESLNEIIKKSPESKRDKLNVPIIRKALYLAYFAHQIDRYEPQKRRDDSEYIMHPIEVAKIVAEKMKLGTKSISAALMHDVIEDNERYTEKDIEDEFSEFENNLAKEEKSPKNIGKIISELVVGLTKFSSNYKEDNSLSNNITDLDEVDKILINKETSDQVRNLQKLLISAGNDTRILLIKLADRFHNMRTLKLMPVRKQYKIASETLNIYAPIAEALGLYSLKITLENLAFKFQEPEQYKKITKKLEEIKSNNFTKKLDKLTKEIERKLITERIYIHSITGRTKSVYSIYKKMVQRGLNFEDIYDILAVRIIFDDPDIPKDIENYEETYDRTCRRICFKIAEVITDRKNYPQNHSRIRDFIRDPKSNGYKSYHLTIMYEGQWVEVQIRSKSMDEIAETGIASHISSYKNNFDNILGTHLLLKKETLKKYYDNQEGFLLDFEQNLNTDFIQIFTPKGERKPIPKGSTALDFAYFIHTDIGNHAKAVKIYGEVREIDYKLKNFDLVEVLTDPSVTPQKEWIDIANSEKTKEKIREYFKLINAKEVEVQNGIEIFRKMLKDAEIEIISSKNFILLKNKFGVEANKDFYKKISENNYDQQILDNFLLELKKQKTTINVKEIHEVDPSKNHTELCDECNPIPGDDIMGAYSGETIIVHKKDCKKLLNFSKIYGDRLIELGWSKNSHNFTFEKKIRIRGKDDKGLVLKIAQIISDVNDINMKDLNFSVNKSGFIGEITLWVTCIEDLNNIINEISNVNGIIECLEIKMKMNKNDIIIN